jgi:cytochrome b pre-mRNA-processing protein 3
MILKLFRSGPPTANIRDLYGVIVAQARRPAFYLDPGTGEGGGYGVPDTVEGRFDLIVLHLVLVLFQTGDQAKSPPLPAQADGKSGVQSQARRVIGQNLFDEFCRDLDDNLREMGVGDLRVPKKMRGFAEAFYGRQAAYVAALAANDRRELENALARNIFDETKAGAGPVRLAAYVRAALSQFKAQGQEAFEAALWRGELSFPEPQSVSAPNQEAIQNG